jgi:hypothetical protein
MKRLLGLLLIGALLFVSVPVIGQGPYTPCEKIVLEMSRTSYELGQAESKLADLKSTAKAFINGLGQYPDD